MEHDIISFKHKLICNEVGGIGSHVIHFCDHFYNRVMLELDSDYITEIELIYNGALDEENKTEVYELCYKTDDRKNFDLMKMWTTYRTFQKSKSFSMFKYPLIFSGSNCRSKMCN